MDGRQFDELTRALAGSTSRRRLLRGLAAGTIGLSARGALAACPAGQVGISGGRCVCKSTMRAPGPTGCPAGPGQTLCNGVAVDYSSDVNNCGSCGYVCPPASTMGACATAPVCRASMCLYPPLPAGTVCRPAVDQCDTQEVCDGSTLACPVDAKAPAGTPCNDGNSCTVNDQCSGSGLCIGTPKVCLGDQCNDVVCRQSDGACITTPKPNGTVCDDGNACTENDTCQGGSCVPGTVVVCTPLDECHVAGVCNPSTGACSNPPAPVDTPCGVGPSCIQGDQHAQDRCNGDGACVAGATSICGLYACGATACLTTCSGDEDCVGTAYCDAGTCTSDQPNGQPCNRAAQCVSGVCNGVNDICCSQSCPSGVGCSGAEYTCGCANDDECPSTQFCTANDLCQDDFQNGGGPCDRAAQCASGICNDVSETCCVADCEPGVGCTGPSGTCAPACGAGGICNASRTCGTDNICCTCAAGPYPASIFVPGNGCGTTTGIFMNAGECVTISATGLVDGIGPNGVYDCTQNGRRCRSLVAGTGDFSFLSTAILSSAFIGEGPTSFRAAKSGELWLQMNSGCGSDTVLGGFTVTFGCGGACQPNGSSCAAMADCCSGTCSAGGVCLASGTCGDVDDVCCVGNNCILLLKCVAGQCQYP